MLAQEIESGLLGSATVVRYLTEVDMKIPQEIPESIEDVKRKLAENVYVIEEVEQVKRSDVWKKFYAIYSNVGHNLTKFVSCKRGGCVLTYSTTNMRKHDCARRSNAPVSVGEDYVPAAKKRIVSDAAALMCCEDLRPFSTVQGSGFKCLAETLISLGAEYPDVDIASILPQPNTVKKRVTSIADSIRRFLTPRLSVAMYEERAALQVDRWADSVGKVHYVTITACIINNDWSMENRVIFTIPFPEETGTPKNILREIVNRFTGLAIPYECLKSTPVVTSNDPSFKCAFREFTRLPCGCHTLNTILKDIFDPAFLSSAPQLAKYKDTIDACKSLVAYLRRAGLWHRLTKTVYHEGEVKWNTLFATLWPVQIIFDEIKEIVPSEEIFRLDKINEVALQELITFLSPFREACEDFEAEASPTLHLPLLWRHKLIDEYLSPELSDNEAIFILKERAKGLFDGPSNIFQIHVYHKVATFLCPPYRDLQMLDEQEREYVKQEVGIMCSKFSGDQGSSSSQPFPPLKFQRYAEKSTEYNVHREVSLYASLTFTNEDLAAESDVTGWWSRHEPVLPVLSKVAKKIFSIPASSSPGERNFSSAGLIVADNRSHLDPSVVEDILLVHSNKDVAGVSDMNVLVKTELK